MRRKLVLIIGASVLVVAGTTLVVRLVVPRGTASAGEALLGRLRETADPGTAGVLVDQRWGEGRLMLGGYRNGDRRLLAIGFAIEQGGRWRLAAYTEEAVGSKDVVVGSLLVASSEGGTGQPAWSVAAGELADPRIERVEIRWASGEVSSGKKKSNAYLVVQKGTTVPLEARYIAGDGTEIAKVPV